MKKRILDLVKQFNRSEGRIKELTIMFKGRDLSYYWINATPIDENANEIAAEEFSTKEEIARFKQFLKAEIVFEKKNLQKTEQLIIKKFKAKILA